MDIHVGDMYLVISWQVALGLIALIITAVAGTILVVRWWLSRIAYRAS